MSSMQDKDLYAQILGIQRPWVVRAVDLDLPGGEVVVHVQHDRQVALRCPECGAEAPGYDSRERRWRHLDTCQYRTILAAEVPRCKCPEHGVRQVAVPWGETGSRFTALFEAVVIDWLKVTSLAAVSRNMGLTWDQLDGIMQRAVRRGLQRREATPPTALGVDETSFKRRHEYVTVVQDQHSGNVDVADGRGRAALDAFYEGLDDPRLGGLESIAMDMHQPYIQSTLDHVPGARQKIAFDKFHVAKHLGDAVDRVRREEHRELKEADKATVTRTKYLWSEPAEDVVRRLGEVRRAAGLRPADGPGLGVEGAGDDAVELRPARVGGSCLAWVAGLGPAVSPEAGGPRRTDDPTSPVGDHQRDRAERDQRRLREPEREDPAAEEVGLRLPEPGAVQNGDHVPSRRAGAVPRRGQAVMTGAMLPTRNPEDPLF